MDHIAEENPPEPLPSTGVSHGITLGPGRTIEAKPEDSQEDAVVSGSDTAKDEIDNMVETLIHEGHLQPQGRRYQ